MSTSTLIGVVALAVSFAIPGSVLGSVFLSNLLRTGVLMAGSFLAAKTIRKGVLERGQQGIQANVLSNEASLPVVYGQARVGLALLDIQQQATSDKVLGYVGAICLGGEDGSGIEEVTTVYFDGVEAISSPTATGAATNVTGTLDPWRTGGTGTTFGDDLFVQYGLHLGADAQTHDTELAVRFSNWGTTDDGRGVAYLAFLLWSDNEVYPAGWPQVTALVKGAKLYDPRDASTAWGDNPALAIWDFMTSLKYGLGIASADLNTASFQAAANYCDVVVSVPGGGTQKRYRCNGWVDPRGAPQENLAGLLSCCRGEIVLIGTEYHLKIRQVQAAESFQLDTTNIVGGFEFWRAGTEEAPNRLVATYVDPDLNFQPNDVSWPNAGASNAYLTADNGWPSTTYIELPFTYDLYQAQQTAQVVLQEARADAGVAFTADRTSLVLQQGDVVEVTHPTPGWAAKKFWIVAMGIMPDGNVRIFGREYDASAYTLNTLPTKDSPPGTNLPNPLSVAAPTSLVLTANDTTSLLLQDGTTVPRILVQWTASADPFLSSYEIRTKVTSEANSTFQVVAVPEKAEVQRYLGDVANGTEYTVEIRAISQVKNSSAWVSDTITVATTESAATGSISVYLDGADIKVNWFGPTAKSIRSVDAATEPNLATTQAGAVSTGTPVTEYTFTASGTRWVGVLLYTDTGGADNESELFTFPITYSGAISGLTRGDIQYANSTPIWTLLPIGDEGALLRAGTYEPAWSAATFPDTVATGDILYASNTNVLQVLTKGAANTFLRMDVSGAFPEWDAMTVVEEVQVGTGLDVANGTGPTATISLDLSEVTDGTIISTSELVFVQVTANEKQLASTIDASVFDTTGITVVGTIATGVWAATDVGLAHGGTGASLADPGADRVMFWDDGAGATTWLQATGGLEISGTDLRVGPGALDETYGGTGNAAWAQYDMIFAISANTLSAIGVGSEGQVMTVSSGIPSWAASSNLTTIAVGSGLDVANATGPTATISLSLDELTLATPDTLSEFVFSDPAGDRIQVAGSIPLSIFLNDSGWTTNVGDITAVTAGTNLTGGGTSGGVTLNVVASPSFTNVTITSDMRLKQPMFTLSGEVALGVVQAVAPSAMNYTMEGHHEVFTGLSAQVVRRAAPTLVRADSEGFLGVDYSSGVVTHLVAALAYLAQRVDDLESHT